MPRLIDISPLVSARIAVWPGDVPYGRQVSLAIAAGANIDLSAITTTVHVGAHADAPSHYVAGGEDIAGRALDRYFGPCQVMRVELPRGARIRPEHLPGPIEAPRLLLHTGSFPDPADFNEDFNSFAPELVAFANERGVQLVGIDTPSIDPFADKVLKSHAAVAARDMAVLEGLVLAHVPSGRYTLVALPLRLEGADASPVRAALVAD
ncbi:MAG TPA: cyclase family protein [Planctomycetota bacterium]